jgi:hypothetical protein
MQKPKDRFILSTTHKDSKLIKAVLLRSGKGTIAEKTFGCSCDTQSSSCDSHCDPQCDCNVQCRCDSQCKHCICVDYKEPCRCDNYCSCNEHHGACPYDDFDFRVK